MFEHEQIAQKLDAIYARVSTIPAAETFLLAQLAWYSCILASAYLERALVEIILDYCRHRSQPAVLKFVGHQLGRFQNPNSERIERLVTAFGEPISGRFRSLFTDQLTSAINSIVNNRNNLAHGRTATVTFGLLKPWDTLARQFVTSLRTQVFV